ncbi:hypothetical protein Ddc_08938 [Ditylenchus destructor]|nr:hypothetical protein Ddc_08938 [Ditylenchus destructor]
MGWCALLPKFAHPRPEIVPYSTVKSPRRNSMFNDLESVASSMSRKSSDSPAKDPIPTRQRQKMSLASLCSSGERDDIETGTGKFVSRNDYLHPKYSIDNFYRPPVEISIADLLLADKDLLRTPVHLHRKNNSLEESRVVNDKRRKSLPSKSLSSIS